jgi:uncharacterized protein (TIGR02453 family)
MFQGYTPETVDFLWGIRLNNNREWFTEHKKQYVDTLYEPTKALAGALLPLIADRPGDLMKVSRIYRDVRLHHPLPYKESLWICIRKDCQWWAEKPCLYFEINPDGIYYGFFYYKPGTVRLENFRRRIAAQPDAFLQLMAQMEETVGQPVTAQVYKRPKPADDPRLAPYFAWKEQFACIRQEPFSEETFGPGLADRVGEFLQKLIPVYDYFNMIDTEA